MSLELKISALTIAIEALTAQMAGAVITPIVVAAEKIIEEAVEEVSQAEKLEQADNETADKINAEAKKKALAKSKAKAKAEAEKLKALAEEDAKDDAPGQEVEVSADDLKAACLTAARAEEGNKVKVKKLLASYDATVVKDVAPGDRAEILAKLEAGEF